MVQMSHPDPSQRCSSSKSGIEDTQDTQMNSREVRTSSIDRELANAISNWKENYRATSNSLEERRLSICLGNEGADLDSCISSIALAMYYTAIDPTVTTVPVVVAELAGGLAGGLAAR